MKYLARGKFCVIVLLGMLLAGAAWAQTPDSTKALVVRIILQDGTTVGGVITKEEPEAIHLRTPGGVEMRIPHDQIREMEWLHEARRSRYAPDPARSRLFLAPTARSLRHLAGYGALYEVLFPSVAIGLVDHLTLIGGMSLFPLFPLFPRIFYAAPKLTLVERERVAVAIGATALTAFGRDAVRQIYVVGTLGSEDALTVGVGRFYDVNNTFYWAEETGLLVGLEHRVAETIKLISENYFFHNVAILSGGTRLLGRTFSADLGLIIVVIDDGAEFGFLPWLGFNYHFGHRR